MCPELHNTWSLDLGWIIVRNWMADVLQNCSYIYIFPNHLILCFRMNWCSVLSSHNLSWLQLWQNFIAESSYDKLQCWKLKKLWVTFFSEEGDNFKYHALIRVLRLWRYLLLQNVRMGNIHREKGVCYNC